MAKQARTRIYGNDAIDGMPELVQEWYHAVGTPMGVGNMAWAKECLKKGVDVNARLDAYGGNALFLAIEQGNWLMVKWCPGLFELTSELRLVEEAQVDLEAAWSWSDPSFSLFRSGPGPFCRDESCKTPVFRRVNESAGAGLWGLQRPGLRGSLSLASPRQTTAAGRWQACTNRSR